MLYVYQGFISIQAFYMTEFDLTFQERFVSFSDEFNRKIGLNCHPPWLAKKKFFYSRSPKTALNNVFLPFYLTENHQICIFYQKTFTKTNCIKDKLNYAELYIHAEKNSLCFYKNSGNQSFTFINSKVVYFKKHLAYQV